MRRGKFPPRDSQGNAPMSYAGSRLIHDADSHLMELPDFLTANADPSARHLMPTLGALATGQFNPGDHVGKIGHAPETVAQLLELGDRITHGPKWHAALGSFSGVERSTALDMLGFQRQVVFSSFCARPIFEASAEARYPTARAHNRAMAAFCGGDPRLIGVAIVPLDDVDLALKEIAFAADLGLGAIWVAAAPPGGRSPGHVSHEPIWATLAERRLPFILHVGSSPLSIDAPWMNDGRPDRTTARGGAEVIGSKDLTVIHQLAQKFISVLVLDGVLERHPDLRGGIIEIGAGWVPDMIRRLDHAAQIWPSPSRTCWKCAASLRSRSATSCASRPIPSRTSPPSSPSHFPSSTCSRRTIPTPRAGAIPSAGSTARRRA